MKRLYALLVYAITLAAVCIATVQSSLEESHHTQELRNRSALLAAGMEDSVLHALKTRSPRQLSRLAERLRKQEGIDGFSLCIGRKDTPFRALSYPRAFGKERLCQNALVRKAILQGSAVDGVAERLQVHAKVLDGKLRHGDQVVLALAQDIGGLRAQWLQNFARAFVVSWLVIAALLALATSQVLRWFNSHLRILHASLRSLIAGRRPAHALRELKTPEVPADLKPITRDIDRLAAKILRLPQADDWLHSLREIMGERKLVVVANREPYIHQRKDDEIHVVRPASGLVTALEPVLRETGGLWVAHGSGSADRETVDRDDLIAVPPGKPTYQLKRVWLSPEEEQGYYYGFSNEGLWPLCHLAHTRPVFRLSDWEHYKAINQRFSDAIPQAELDADSLVLVQDYHFALAPRAIRARAGNRSKVGLFWHIPWPNPEAFGICPWNQELLRGMLGADVVGFHTQYHCNNFLETCDRYLEARVDWEHFSVTMENHETLVRAFPIGIATHPVRHISDDERETLKARHHIRAPIVAIGVDRIDYTKGLAERIESVERFLEKYPEYIGKFSLVQIGSPSRATIPAYRALAEQLLALTERVNRRFGSEAEDGYKPVIFLNSHHEWDEIQYLYQIGDVCMVTSLHDGMNLVAKEYIWCNNPERGALILSKFTGASRELTEAVIVNPYSIEEMADAIAASLTMPAEERQRRMRAMREKVLGHNAFHWATDLIRALVVEVKAPESALTPAQATGLEDKSRSVGPAYAS